MTSGKIKPGRFQPAWWLPGPHLQTLWPHLCRRIPAPALTAERLELPDGDFLDLCWTQRQSGPIVLVFHGLEGSINSNYARGIMTAIDACGWRGVFMYFRGCSNEFNRLDRNYHSGDTGDIAYLIKLVAQRFPHVPLGAVGYSLGGNALLKYLGECPGHRHLAAAVAVSVPFLLDSGAERLNRGISKIYQRHLLGRLQRKMRAKYRHRPFPVPLERLGKLNTFRQFDDQITAPLHGFRDVDDYYRRASSRQFLKYIKTPTLVIQARNDPFITPAAIPTEPELAASISLELADRGGHVGFVSGKYPWQARYWLEQRIPEFLTPYLE